MNNITTTKGLKNLYRKHKADPANTPMPFRTFTALMCVNNPKSQTAYVAKQWRTRKCLMQMSPIDVAKSYTGL